MSNANLFAPPVATVRDILPQTPEYQPIRLWSTRGRIGRLRYLFYAGGMSVVVTIANIVIGMIAAMLAAAGGLPGWTVFALPGILWVVYTVFTILLLIQRSHDMDWSGWTVLAALIPFVGFIWLFKAGTPGVNSHGAPPPPNSTGVKVFTWLFVGLIAIAMIGVLAAVTLPAYQQYVKRANGVRT